MRLNLRLVRALQFLQQFKLDVRHKPGKEHIIPDVLSRLASTNVGQTNPSYSELDVLFVYNTTLVEIYPDLLSKILAGYNADAWWSWLQRQVHANKELHADKALLPFVSGLSPPTDAETQPPEIAETPQQPFPPTDSLSFPPRDKTKLLYHINRTISIQYLYIPPSVAPEILAITHGEGHPGFSRCYKIITRSWFIRGLTKLLRAFIRHCPECLALQTRRHPPYGSL